MSAEYTQAIQILGLLGIGTILGYFIKYLLDRQNLKLTYRHRIAEKLAEKVIDYSEKYYMPLTNSLNDLVSHLDRTLKNPTEEEKRYSFYILAVCLSTRNKLVAELGGLVLRRVETEQKLELIYRDFLEEMKTQAKMTLADISAIEKLVSPKEFAHDFLSKIDENTTLNEIYRKFDQWLKNTDSVKKLISHVTACRDLFIDELNLIYEPWYGKTSGRAKS